MGKLNNILLLSGTSSPTAIKSGRYCFVSGQQWLRESAESNVEGTLSILLERQENPLLSLITSLLLHAGTNHRQVNWSLAIL
jgi:hypothetical protein